MPVFVLEQKEKKGKILVDVLYQFDGHVPSIPGHSVLESIYYLFLRLAMLPFSVIVF